MSRSYPIWNKIQACIYQSDKSFGARDESTTTVLVGSSASNSHELVNHRTIRRENDKEVVFKFYVDDIKIKEMIFEKDSKRKLSKEPSINTFLSIKEL
jgi:hypothetical protein